jgi:hypothetical protein
MLFSERRYVLMPPYAYCNKIFGMNGIELLYLAISKLIPNIGLHSDVVDSYRLKENDMIFTIHTLNIN